MLFSTSVFFTHEPFYKNINPNFFIKLLLYIFVLAPLCSNVNHLAVVVMINTFKNIKQHYKLSQ